MIGLVFVTPVALVSRWPRCRIRFARVLTSLHLILTCLVEKARGPRDLAPPTPVIPRTHPRLLQTYISPVLSSVHYQRPPLVTVSNHDTGRLTRRNPRHSLNPRYRRLELLRSPKIRLSEKRTPGHPGSDVLYPRQSRPFPCTSPASCRSPSRRTCRRPRRVFTIT